MSHVLSLIQTLAAALSVVTGTISVTTWAIRQIKKFALEKKGAEIQRFLQELGLATESAIRDMVEEAGRKIPGFSPDRQEEIIHLLVSLSCGARFLTTHGQPRSSYLRSEKWLDLILSNFQPARKAGEMVAPGKDWTLERFLGMGSFGEVWMARNKHSQRLPPRAFKFFTRAEAQEWIRKEQHNLAEIMHQLGHSPFVTRLFDVEIENQPWPFLELEYVEGGSLEDWILEDPGRRPKLDKLQVMRAIATGLAEAHARGISHRDLKPANLLLTGGPDIQVKIADFGMARVEPESNAGRSAFLSQAAAQGTPMYLPPEAQEAWAERDPARDDVFAAGVIWYQLLVERLERPPYDYQEVLRELGEDSHTIRLMSCCLAQPSRRFADAAQLAAALDEGMPPDWAAPEGYFNVQHLVREYLALTDPQ
jgi:eukaryotic-like serine/threonine-protein kinase